MKTTSITSLIFGIFMLVACTDTTSDEFCENPQAKCPDTSAIEASSCCTNQDCYWLYNGVKYDCNGEDCADAINAIVASACTAPTGMIDITETDFVILKAQMQAVTSKLLLEARAASGCVD